MRKPMAAMKFVFMMVCGTVVWVDAGQTALGLLLILIAAVDCAMELAR